MTPPARPGTPVPRGGPARPAPPRPAPPRPRRTPATGPAPSTGGRSGDPDPGAGGPGVGRPGVGGPGVGGAGASRADAPREPSDAQRPDGTAPAGPSPAPAGPTPVGPTSVGPIPGGPSPAAFPPPPSTTSDAVTTYTARRRALGIPVRRAVVSAGSAARFAERVAMRRRLARHRAYVAGAVVVLLGALAWLLLLSPVLALDAREVQVTGAGTVVDPADVHAVVAELDGVPLPRLDTVGLRDRVLEVPGVRSAKVSRIWPHGLVVSLVSREPVAAVPQGTSSVEDGVPAAPGYTLLDVDGFTVGWTPTPPPELPVVDVPVVTEGRNHSLDAVLAILRALPPELAAEVATVEAGTRDTVRMGLRDGRSVVWGSASDAALKIRVLQALRAAPAAAGAREYDVSAPSLPITR